MQQTHTPRRPQFKPFPFTVITVVVDIANVKLGGQLVHTFWGRIICNGDKMLILFFTMALKMLVITLVKMILIAAMKLAMISIMR